MKIKIKEKKIHFRKLKISDYDQFKNLFFSCFKKKVSLDFFRWNISMINFLLLWCFVHQN